MYSVTVRGHMMIAHSLKGAVFGPAQRLHGATYVVDVEFRAAAVDANGIVVDMGRATARLDAVLGTLAYRNLDEDPSFGGRNTTTELLAKTVFDRMAAAIASGAWYENFAEHMRLAPIDFAMSYITRSGRIDMNRLHQISPRFAARYEREHAAA